MLWQYTVHLFDQQQKCNFDPAISPLSAESATRKHKIHCYSGYVVQKDFTKLVFYLCTDANLFRF